MATPGGSAHSWENRGLACPTPLHPPIENIGENPRLSNRFSATFPASAWKLTAPRHKQAVRALAHTLFLGESRHWPGLALVLAARLTETERALLAFAALRSLDPEPRALAFAMAHRGTPDAH